MDTYIDHIATRLPSVEAFAHFAPAQAPAATPGPLQGIPVAWARKAGAVVIGNTRTARRR
jgi:hypothetical protein